MTRQTDIHLEWEGPLTFEDARSRWSDRLGRVSDLWAAPHLRPRFTLIHWQGGKAAFRCSTHTRKLVGYGGGPNRMSVYLGRLAGRDAPDNDTWCRYIDLAEGLLIFVHRPAWNAQTNILDSIPTSSKSTCSIGRASEFIAGSFRPSLVNAP